MLIVEMIAKIRRAFFVQGKPIKAICRELRISRKVVRKVLRSEATEFRYDPPSKWWTPLISSFGSGKVFDGYIASPIHG